VRSHPLIAALALSSLAVGQIPLPKNTTSYTSTRARGFFFKAPAPFIVTHVQVPDESANGLQAVALYKLNAAPPAYSSTINATPVFYKDGVSSDQYIPVLPPIQVKKDEVFVALGVTYAQNSNRYTSSYGAAQFSSSILGNAITLQRCGTQDDFVGLQGAVTLWSEVSGSNGRVRVFALSQGEARIFGIGSGTGTPPQMLVSDEKPPMIGSSGEFFVQANASNLAGVLLLSTGKLNSTRAALRQPSSLFAVDRNLPPWPDLDFDAAFGQRANPQGQQSGRGAAHRAGVHGQYGHELRHVRRPAVAHRALTNITGSDTVSPALPTSSWQAAARRAVIVGLSCLHLAGSLHERDRNAGARPA
jgi:hypothetical protein